mmetsp:Transcript_14603/g.32829  ORF Transcript_14603/g.32829 Transcript_14603/m.32829 type:complete len:578 (-) Transcript_14603:142-1875(-)
MTLSRIACACCLLLALPLSSGLLSAGPRALLGRHTLHKHSTGVRVRVPGHGGLGQTGANPNPIRVTALAGRSPVADEIEGWLPSFYDTFVTHYWQRKPLLIRKAFPHIQADLNLDPEDFYQLAADADVDTRLFRKRGRKPVKEYGPFEQEYLRSLPPGNWSILLQEVDRHIPRVADLWTRGFSFIPSWRRDDIMISYSLPGGSIGGHVDNYDVFLLQGSGSREWAIENVFLTEREEKIREVPNSATRMLRDFQADQKWVMEAGDMLYVPPRVPHRGTTLEGPCTTISVGFRAPNYKSLVTALWEDICTNVLSDEDCFYSDIGDLTAAPQSPGLVSPQARGSIAREIVQKVSGRVQDSAAFDSWLGKYLTTPLRYRLRPASAFFLQTPETEADADMETETDAETETESPGTRGDSGDSDGSGDSDESEGSGDSGDSGDSGEFDDDYDDDEDDEEEGDGQLPFAVRVSKHKFASDRQWADVESLLLSVLRGECALRRAEGMRMAYIGDTLFIDGEPFLLPSWSTETGDHPGALLTDQITLTPSMLQQMASATKNTAMNRFICGLLRSGFYYPVDFPLKQ